ncbi:hypothetical protein pb186bvf_020372 [Paramecium bursaria]
MQHLFQLQRRNQRNKFLQFFEIKKIIFIQLVFKQKQVVGEIKNAFNIKHSSLIQ